MGTLYECKNLRLTEENFGGLWLYLRETTLEIHEGTMDFDFAFNFNEVPGDAQSVIDRQGRITIISNKHGLITYDIQKETFKQYPDFKLREPRTYFTALLQ